LKIRLGVKTDEEVKRILRRLYSLKYHSGKYKPNQEDESNNNVIVNVFRGEPITWESFVSNNLNYLDLLSLFSYQLITEWTRNVHCLNPGSSFRGPETTI
jgi:hypothetical protein